MGHATVTLQGLFVLDEICLVFYFILLENFERGMSPTRLNRDVFALRAPSSKV